MEKEETVYSWSRVNGFYQALKGEGCMHGWSRAYNEKDRGEGNYFSSVGTLMHDTIYKVNNGDLFPWDVEDEITKLYRNIEFKPPFPRMGKSYKESLWNFFLNRFEETFNKYTLLEAEEEKKFSVGKYKLKGFPDYVANHEDHGFVIADFKSSKKYEGEKLEHNIMQLYLYSIPIKEKYGRYPDKLVFIYPRLNEIEFAYDFDIDKLEKTKEFISNTIDIMNTYNFDDVVPRCLSVDGKKDFYANHLCNHRNKCDYK